MYKWILSLIVLQYYIQHTYTQCCVTMIGKTCIQCPKGTHLFLNNCLMNLDYCLEYIEGFTCSKCIQGFQLDQQTKTCIIINVPQGQIPRNGFEPVIIDLSSPTIIVLVSRSKLLFDNETEDMELNYVLLRESNIPKVQKIYRMIFSTIKGFLQAIYNIGDDIDTPTLLGQKVFTIASNQQFTNSLTEEFLNRIKVEIDQTYPLLQQNQNQIVDIFSSNKSDSETNLRIFFFNVNLGLIELNITIQSFNRTGISDLITQAIQQFVASGDLQETYLLVNFVFETIQQNSENVIIFNATFESPSTAIQKGCLWIYFRAPTNTNKLFVILQKDKCFVPIPIICQALIGQLTINITFIQIFNNDFQPIDNQAINNYIFNCRNIIRPPQIISSAIGQNETMVFYQIKLQFFESGQRLDILTLGRNKQQEFAKIISTITINVQSQTMLSIPLGTELPQLSQEILNIIQTIQGVSSNNIENGNLLEIEYFTYNLSANLIIRRYIMKYAFPMMEPYENRNFKQYQIDIIPETQIITILPTIQIPKEQYQLITQSVIQATQRYLLLANRAIQLIQQQKQNQNISGIEIFEFKQSLNRTNTFLISFTIERTIQKYIFTNNQGQIQMKIVEVINTSSEIDLNQLPYQQIVKFICLVYQQEIKQYQLEIQSGEMIYQTLIEESFILAFVSQKHKMNVTILRLYEGQRFSIYNVTKSWQQPQLNSTGKYENVEISKFKELLPIIYQQYTQTKPQLKENKLQLISSIFKNQLSVIIVEKQGRQYNISRKNQTINIHTQFQLKNITKIKRFEPAIMAIFQKFKLKKVDQIFAIRYQELFGGEIQRYAVKVTTKQIQKQQQQKYLLIFQSIKNSSEIIFVSLKNIKYAEIKKITYKSQTPVQKLKENVLALLEQEIKIICAQQAQNNSEISRIAYKSRQFGVLEIIVSQKSGKNPEILGITSFSNGFSDVGFDSNFTTQQQQKLQQSTRINVQLYLKSFNFNNRVHILKSNQIILWKQKNFSKQFQQFQIICQVQNSSYVIKATILQIQQKIHLIQLSSINNNMLKMLQHQKKNAIVQTEQVRYIPIFLEAQSLLLKTYWYYLRGSQILHARKIKTPGQVHFVAIYQIKDRHFQAILTYSEISKNFRVASLTPIRNLKSRLVYACNRYSYYGECMECNPGYKLDTNHECLPIMDGCIVQSGNICFYGSYC